jgi:hypothetical protein
MTTLEIIELFWAACYRQDHQLPEPPESTDEKQENLPL